MSTDYQSIGRLITLPPAAAAAARVSSRILPPGWFAACDPPGRNLGSGGGTAHALASMWRDSGSRESLLDWIQASPKLVVHGGGESRRLPPYSVLGKPLIPIPRLPGEPGSRSDRSLLVLQSDSYEWLLRHASWARLLVASGDVLLRLERSDLIVPEADVVIFGCPMEPESAVDFGVLFVDRRNPPELRTFLQKPDLEEVRSRMTECRILVDTGAWLLGPRAVKAVLDRCGYCENKGGCETPEIRFELYAGLGPALGADPNVRDAVANALSAAVVELPAGAFFHFGTTRQMVESAPLLMNGRDPVGDSSPVILQSTVGAAMPKRSGKIWIADSVVPESWRLLGDNVVTGVPGNSWTLNLPESVCVDMTPVVGGGYCLRTYGLDDQFRGRMDSESTLWFGRPAGQWLSNRAINAAEAGIRGDMDIFDAPLFPVISPDEESERVQWILDSRPDHDAGLAEWWVRSQRLSARAIASRADIGRMLKHRALNDIPTVETAENEDESLSRLRDSIVDSALSRPVTPRRNILEDQIVWSRCPVRLDLAGGWTDTPPYCILNGGSVLNAAVELNGQPPIQVFAKLSRQPEIVIRSIDLGTEQRITAYEQLGDYANPRSDFSLARAALCIAGLHPRFADVPAARNLPDRLEALGGGIEISLLAAVPQGSGLGTSSILAVTLLAALSELYGLDWTHQELIARTLAVEQLVTTGGGWQDQAGGLFPGVKLLETAPGLPQAVRPESLPEDLLADGAGNGSILLYYTGLTRLAKGILQEVVRGMFLKDQVLAAVLDDIGATARAGAESIRREDRDGLCACVLESWRLNQELDRGTNPPEVQAILARIQDYVDAAKLLGAGGGGYLLLFAKDEHAGGRIRRELLDRPPNSRARFVDFGISAKGLETTRS